MDIESIEKVFVTHYVCFLQGVSMRKNSLKNCWEPKMCASLFPSKVFSIEKWLPITIFENYPLKTWENEKKQSINFPFQHFMKKELSKSALEITSPSSILNEGDDEGDLPRPLVLYNSMLASRWNQIFVVFKCQYLFPGNDSLCFFQFFKFFKFPFETQKMWEGKKFSVAPINNISDTTTY